MIASAAVCAALVLASCGSSKESAYRKAYEKAKAQEEAPVQQPAPVEAPVVERPATETQVVDNSDNVAVRTENVSVVSGAGLKGYSVVVGSYGLKANAESHQARLSNAGYSAQIAFNAERNMYRVVATTFDNKIDAVRSRDALRSQYPDAWLLFAK